MTPAEHHLYVLQRAERAADIHSSHVDSITDWLEGEGDLEDERPLADVIEFHPTAYPEWYGTEDSAS